MTLVPDPNAELLWAWTSPSEYWKVTKVQPVHQTGRRSFESWPMMLIEFTHHKENGDRLVIEGYVSRKEELADLATFLDASAGLPHGIRLRIHTIRKAPWDSITPRYRP